MLDLLAISASLCISAGPPASSDALVVPRFKPATLPEGALARFGGNRFTALRPLSLAGFAAGGKEVQAWDGHTLHRWAFPSGRPIGRVDLPASVNPPGRPFAFYALSPEKPQLAWIHFEDDKERLRIYDFQTKKLALDRDITLDNKKLDYAGLAWSEDATRLLALIEDKRLRTYDLEGKLLDTTRLEDNKEKNGLLLPSGEPWRDCGPLQYGLPGLTARVGKSRILIKHQYHEGRREGRSRYPLGLLAFTDLDSKKTHTLIPSPELIQPGHAALSRDGRYLALIDNYRMRLFDVVKRREIDRAHAFPEITHMVVSPGGAHVQFQPTWLRFQGQPWHSLSVADGRERVLVPRAYTEGITLGLGEMGFAVGKDQFIGITARSVDRWDLKTGRCLDGVPFTQPPHEKDEAIGYDECLLLGDGFKVAQFTCIVKRDNKAKDPYRPTWRLWSPADKDPPIRPLVDCTWQRGAAALPRGRFLYFAIPTDAALSKAKEVAPGVTLLTRGETQMYLAEMARMDKPRMAIFSGVWSELRGNSRLGHLLLMETSSSAWAQMARGISGTWTDPAAHLHGLLEFHTGETVADSKKLGAIIRNHASHLSPDGRFLLAGGDGKLLIVEPYVVGKAVKEIPLPATPKRFASSKDGTRVVCQLDDATLMIFDGEKLARLADEAVAGEVPRDLNALVADLSNSPNRALRAARLLAAAGEAGVAALRKGIDGTPPDGKQVAAWIRDLDSDESATRDKAESSLAAWGLPIEKALREEMDARPSAEKRLRLRRLLARFARGPYGNRELAQARAVLALDWNASPAAAKLLAEWAEKYPGSVLGGESKFALSGRAGR